MSRRSYFFEGFVMGAVVGAVAGVLFAPDEGDKTRSKLVSLQKNFLKTMDTKIVKS